MLAAGTTISSVSTMTPKYPRMSRICMSPRRPPRQAGDAASMAATFPTKHSSGGAPFTGRDTQSIVFFKSGVIEPLYSGLVMRSASCAKNKSFNARPFAGKPSFASRSPLYSGKGKSAKFTCVSVASVDRSLIDELQVLWANFGVKSSVNQMRGHEQHELPDGKGGRKSYWSNPIYRLLITSIKGCRIAEEVTGLGASRKSDAAQRYLENLRKEGYEQKLHATFKGLTPLPNEDAYFEGDEP